MTLGLALSRVLLPLGLLLTGSCRSHEVDGQLEPVVRIGEERGEISASIGDETRYVLSGLPRAILLMGASFDVPADGELSIHRVLSPRLLGADRVVVQARATVDSRTWSDLPLAIAPVSRAGRRESVDIRLDFPPEMRGRQVRLHGVAWVPRPAEGTREVGPPMTVPKAAVVEVGGGILDPGRAQGDVRFSVEVCERDACAEVLSETVAGASGRWSDWRIALDRYAGKEITLAFETELLGGSTDSYSMAVWSRPTVYAPRADPDRTNVILLSIDTLRADHLSTYGYERDTAPKLRSWFDSDGVVFDNTVAAATTTGPSHMTMFTSVTPTVHGIAEQPGVGSPPPITLAEVLRSRGYATGAITEDGPLHAQWGFSRGFDSYAENKSADVMLPEGHVAATFAKAEAWLRRQANKPFFLFLHTFEVHYPYTPPARYAALFGNPERPAGLPADYAPELYDREIRYVDDQFDSFLRKLQGAGLLDRTIVIVTSDHGEEFLEHGFIGHGGNLHPEVLHVPFLVRGPGIRGGRRIAAPVAHTDLMPTVLALLGIDSPAVMMGRSLADVLRGESSELAAAPLYSEAWYPVAMLAKGRTRRLEPPSISVRRGDRKLIRSNRQGGAGYSYRYYELAADPHEEKDLYGADPGAAADLEELLATYEPQMNEVRRRSAAARSRFSEGDADRAGQVEVDPAVREKLRALGYVE
jgi:arylsulfatase A-like enzyme